MNETPVGRPAVQPQRLRQLLRRLIDVYSPSGKEEEILQVLNGYLRRHGLKPVRQMVDEHRWNLLVLPSTSEIRVALLGHVDTVTAYDLEDFGCEEQDGLIMGLGSADMKAGCAAMVEGYLAAMEAGFHTMPVALMFLVGEEQDGDGAQRLVKEFHFPWAVIGEPTDLQVCLSHYSYVEVQIVIRGKRMHASLAEQGCNAIEAMLPLLHDMIRYWARGSAEAIYNIRELSSSSAGFVVPDRCEAWLDVHLPPSAPLGEITSELEEIVARNRPENPCLNAVVRFPTVHSGYEIPDKGPLVETLRSVFRRGGLDWNPNAFRSHSDANILWMAGVKPILFGPGQLEKAHVQEESVPFSQVCTAAQIYADLLVSVSEQVE